MVCFSVTDSISFNNVKGTWIKELRDNQPEAKVLLAGTKADLRGTFSDEEAQDPRKKEVKMIKDL